MIILQLVHSTAFRKKGGNANFNGEMDQVRIRNEDYIHVRIDFGGGMTLIKIFLVSRFLSFERDGPKC